MDARALIAGGGGLRRYTAELLRGLLDLRVDVSAWIAGWHVDGMRAGLEGELARLGLSLPVSVTRAPGKLLYDQPGLSLWPHWPRLLPPPRLLPKDIDLFHAIHWPLPLDRRPMVLTVHDLIALRHPEWVPANVLAVHRAVAALAPRAAHVIADSHATADEVLALTKVNPERLSVVPLGVDRKRFARETSEQARVETIARYGLTRPYFITIGSIEPRRNTARVIEAYDLLCDRGQCDWDLLILGGIVGDYPEAQAQLQRPRAGRVHMHEGASDEDLVTLLQSAGACICVSLAEGFGLPVLEGFAAGCPVVAANATSLPEVAGDAALLVDPYDPEAIADAMRGIAGEPALAADLRQRGHERVTQFTWERTARMTLDVYRQAIL
jgi:glycosyltransferase involved in cell wall biosynthesis